MIVYRGLRIYQRGIARDILRALARGLPFSAALFEGGGVSLDMARAILREDPVFARGIHNIARPIGVRLLHEIDPRVWPYLLEDLPDSDDVELLWFALEVPGLRPGERYLDDLPVSPSPSARRRRARRPGARRQAPRAAPAAPGVEPALRG